MYITAMIDKPNGVIGVNSPKRISPDGVFIAVLSPRLTQVR